MSQLNGAKCAETRSSIVGSRPALSGAEAVGRPLVAELTELRLFGVVVDPLGEAAMFRTARAAASAASPTAIARSRCLITRSLREIMDASSPDWVRALRIVHLNSAHVTKVSWLCRSWMVRSSH